MKQSKKIGTPLKTKRCLLVTRTRKVGGAEKLVHELHQCKYGPEFKTEMVALDSSEAFRALLGRYDLIHSHLFLPGLMIRLRRLIDSNFVWIHSVHYGSYKFQKGGLFKKWLDRHFIFPGADELVAVSQSVAESLKGVSCRRINVIPNGLRPVFSEPRKRSLTGQSGPLVLGTISMLRREKGIPDLIYALNQMLELGVHVRLRIAGEGPERNKIEKLVERLKISDAVDLIGFVDDIEDFTNSIDIFVNSSKIESFGLATLEAMNRGVPLVATSVGETPNLLQYGKFGRLVDRDCTDFQFHTRLREAIEIVSHSLDKYSDMASSGARFHRVSSSMELFLERHRALYLNALKPGVCMISPIVTHSTGGMQKQMKLQSQALIARGYRVFILQRRDPYLGRKYGDWENVVFLQTRSVIDSFKNPRLLPLIHRLNGLLFVIEGFALVIKNRHRFQILHAHQLFSPTTIGFLSKLFIELILIVKVTASGVYGERNEIQKLPFSRLRRATFRKIDSLIVLTEEMAEEMYELGFEQHRVALIPNSVEVDIGKATPLNQNYKNSEASHLDAKKPFKILYTGRLSTEKSIETIIEAVDLLAKSGLRCELTIVGGGSQGGRDCELELRNLAIKAHPLSTIHFTGHVEQVEAYYQTTDAFVLASISEGMSNSLLEAMSFGKACVVSDISANLSIITPEVDALIFPTKNAEQLAAQLRRISNSGPETVALRASLGNSARSTIAGNFSVQSVTSEIIRLYQSLQGRVTPPADIFEMERLI